MNFKNLIKSLRPAVGLANQSSRERWLESTLASIPAGGRILDAAAGTQRYKKFCSHLQYVSQDFGAYDGTGDSAALQTGTFDYGRLDILSDIISIPEPDGSFDAIMCIEALEHLPDPIPAIREFARLLRPGGHLVLTAPFCSLTHFAPYHFSSGFNRYWYERHLTDNGFSIAEIRANGNFFEYLAQEIYRIGYAAQRYAQDRPRLLESLGIYIVQRMLLRLSRRGGSSAELLCFGYHVHARKR